MTAHACRVHVAVLVSLVAILAFVTPASVDQLDGGASLGGEGTMTGHGEYTGSGASIGDHASGNKPVVDYATYEVLGDGAADAGDLSHLCFVDGDATKPGFQYRIIGTSQQGLVVEDRLVCRVFDQGPPPLPQPPTIEEIWGAAQVPLPEIVTDPSNRGITGLNTHITSAGPTSITLDLAIRGYHIVGTARLDHYAISIDGGAERIADHDVFTFETKGNHTITLAAVWHGTATLSGPDIRTPIFLGDIGQATMTSTRTYAVHEIRSVLQP